MNLGSSIIPFSLFRSQVVGESYFQHTLYFKSALYANEVIHCSLKYGARAVVYLCICVGVCICPMYVYVCMGMRMYVCI